MTITTASDIRPAVTADLPRLTAIWFDGWRDAHATIVPAELVAQRTAHEFASRLQAFIRTTRVADVAGAASGFCIAKDDELYQLFVAADARGTGVAAALIADFESRLKESGAPMAWLACAVGNDRAAAFYEKSGWHRAGVVAYELDTPGGPSSLDVWRYEKSL